MPLTSMGPWTGQDFEWYDVNWTCPLQEMVPQPQGESPLTAEGRRQWKNAKATQCWRNLTPAKRERERELSREWKKNSRSQPTIINDQSY